MGTCAPWQTGVRELLDGQVADDNEKAPRECAGLFASTEG